MPLNKCKVIFFGTPEFAVPALESLIKADFCDVLAVVTQPDKPVGRHRSKLIASPVKMAAQGHKIAVFDSFEDFRTQIQRPEQSEGSLGILVAYGEILPKSLLDHFPFGIVNIHPSLLPKYRGPSPIQTTILNRDQETGVSIIKLDEGMDSGPIIAQEVVSLRAPSGAPATDGAKQSYYRDKDNSSDRHLNRDDKIASLGVAPRNDNLTAGELHDKLAQIGAELLIKILPDYISGKIKPIPQEGQPDLSPADESKTNESEASYTKKLTKEDGKIDWTKSAEEIDALVRAMNPWPGAWTMWEGKKLIIWQTDRASKLERDERPSGHGSALSGEQGRSTSERARWASERSESLLARLQLKEVQLEGSKRMSIDDFLRGHPNFILPSSSH